MLFDNYHRFIKYKLKEISNKNQLRQLIVSRRDKNSIVVNDSKKLISFACNDYLSGITSNELRRLLEWKKHHRPKLF